MSDPFTYTMSPETAAHPLTPIAQAFGYEFSHQTRIGRQNGTFYSLACFKNTHNPALKYPHTVSFNCGTENTLHPAWATQCTPATGLHWTGHGVDTLILHLRRKARRYHLPRF